MGEVKERKVLIVDDEQVNITLLRAYLKDSYDIISAQCGEEALHMAREHEPDIVLLDIMMPGITGYEVCRVLKDSEKTRFIPVVMVTALSGTEDRIRGLQAGADDFLTKPLDRIEIVARVSSLLRIKHLHDELINERDQAHLYLDLAAVMLLVMDEKGTVKLLNKKGYDVLGYTDGELDGINWFDKCVPVSEREQSRVLLTDFFSGDKSFEGSFESPVLTSDGKERIIGWNNVVLMKDCGDVSSLLISGTDITEKKDADEKIKRANEYLGNLLEASPIATLSIDIDMNITTANKNAANLLCMPVNDLVGKSISSLVEGNVFSDFKDIRDSEVTFRRGDGEKVPMNVSTSLIKNDKGGMGLIIALQELSKLRGLFITPLTEDMQHTGDDLQHELEPGSIYLADCNRKDEGYLLFSKLVKQGKPGLCITRKNPEKIRQLYGLSKTPLVWMTRNKNTGQQALDPSELFKIHPTIHDFIHKVSDGIILVDGLEYLLLDNDFISVIKLIEQTNDTVMASDSRLIVQVDPGTLDKKDFHLLKRWMKPLKVPKDI
jgi:two-component system cell cycle response regulator